MPAAATTAGSYPSSCSHCSKLQAQKSFTKLSSDSEQTLTTSSDKLIY